MHKFNTSFAFHFHILGLTPSIQTDPPTEGLKFASPSERNSYEGFNLEHTDLDAFSTSKFQTFKRKIRRKISPLYLMENLPGGQLPIVLSRLPVNLLSQKKGKKGKGLG